MSNDAPETNNGNTQDSGSSERGRKKVTSNESGGIVKANSSEIIVLEDNTRVVETDTLPNNRPITVSEFEVVDTLSSAGIRPVMANTFEVANTDHLPGHRPVAVSTLDISDLDTLPGHRPIASNDIDEDSAVLMGYLD